MGNFLQKNRTEKKSSDITNLRAFIIKYIGPTNYRPARVKIYDARWKKSKTISGYLNDAIAHVERLGCPIVYKAESGADHDILLSDEFKNIF